MDPTPACPPLDAIEGRIRVLVEGQPVELPCDEHLICRRHVRVTVENSSPYPLVLRGVTIERLSPVQQQGSSYGPEPAPEIASGAAHVIDTLQMWMPGEYELVAFIAAPCALEVRRAIRVQATSKRWLAARRACEKCNGDWGRRGYRGTEGCLCRTSDGGKTCYHPDDCEADCRFREVEVVRPASRDCRTTPCRELPELVRPVGQCTEFETSFGCFRRVLDWPQEPVARNQIRTIRMCVD